MTQVVSGKKHLEELGDTDDSDPSSASEDFSENDEAENTQMNNSSLLEKTDIENKMTEIPLETIIPPKANTVKCIHCGKSYTSRGIISKPKTLH